MTASAEKLAALRAGFKELGIDGVLVPRADAHLGETVPADAERLAWLTGFDGSAGLAIILPDRAIVFSDGRYVLQLQAQTDATLFERGHVTETPPRDWLRDIGSPLRIGYDPRLSTEDEIERLGSDAVTLVPLAANPIDAIWTDRPPPPPAPARALPDSASGRPSADKRAAMAADLARSGEDAAVLTDPASVAWLLNIRGADLPTTPVALAFAILHADERVELFAPPGKIPLELGQWLGNSVSVASPDTLAASLARLAGRRVRVDRAASPAWFAHELRASGAAVIAAPDPCIAAKARKNAVELAGIRACHIRDGAAVVRFLAWLAKNPGQTEISAATRLHDLRATDRRFLSDSFDAISGAGPHGAVIHYRATPETDRPIHAHELYLIDSGGQYEDGTTDITRTVWIGDGTPPQAQRDQFTRVLRGHIALATARFPDGLPGHRLDPLARVALWEAGLDYDHGTGHGVGHVLSVHEGPAGFTAIPRPAGIRAGMVLSNEPGCYVPGSHGIRIENLMAVTETQPAPGGKPFLAFETLTLAPIDRTAIDPALLDAKEHAWLDAYHARVLRELSPLLDPAEVTWLEEACAPL